MMAIHGSLAIAEQAYGARIQHMEHIRHKFTSTRRNPKRQFMYLVECLWTHEESQKLCKKKSVNFPIGSQEDIKTMMT